MSRLREAESILEHVDAAISAGDMVRAGELMREVRPLLVSERIDELMTLKNRIDNMVLQVRSRRTEQRSALARLVNRKSAINQYERMVPQAGVGLNPTA